MRSSTPTKPALLLTPQQAAAALAISPRKLWGMTASGELLHIWLGRCFLPQCYSYASIRLGMSAGGSANCSIRSRIAAKNFRVIAISTSWNVTYFACHVTLAPISPGSARWNRKRPRLCRLRT